MAKPSQSTPRSSLPLGSSAAPPQPQKTAADQPRVADAVLVKTAAAIGGVREHAAIVTHVYDDGDIDVLLMPRGAQPYPVSTVRPASSGAPMSWRART